ncbi:FadR/GntR family transcriptional regulator [Pengzhenrongella sicca]|uniref:FadR family transcriptional regulator n=1 Tax=Pengzhenrongella sicca TaxID=2819238 RepID=A0A8A4ZEF8_9MICO|nr:FCD domain-containing protein [Pengzhenrongella sicca]QTE29293.1 FadR family transcriptional regulator [Pengzhenrongella sicca]
MRTQVDESQSGLHERVLAQLGPAIVAGEPAEGAVLTIDEIAAGHGVSRTVARDVVKVLESLQLVSTRRRIGVTVRPRAQWNVFDPRLIRWRLAGPDRALQLRTLSELRHGVEPIAASLAAANASPEQCGALTAAVIGMSVTGRRGALEEYLQYDMAFHRTLLAASGNDMFAALAGVVGEVLAGRTHHDLMPAHPEPAAIRLHADIAEAVASGDAAGAGRAMKAIVDEAQQAMAAAFPTF